MDASSFLLLLLLTLCIAGLIRSILLRRKTTDNLPPGPSFLSSNLLLLTKSLTEIGPIIKNLKSKYGPFISLSTGSRHFIYVGDHSLVHQVLIQKGAIFADRPRVFPVRTISTAAYGPTWRFLRRNLVSEILHPTRIKSYSWARKWVLHKLIAGLQERKPAVEEAAGIIKLFDHFQYAMFSLLALMCFGEKLDDHLIKEISAVQFRWMFLVSSGRLNGLAIFPRLGKILFRNRLKQLLEIRNEQERLMIPLIKSRINSQSQSQSQSVADDHQLVAYVDTLMNLRLPEEDGNGRKLTDKEMVSMCGEFFNGGTDTTATALLWIMANLVKYPHIQSKLYDEIISVVGPPPPPPPPGVELESIVKESDVQKMPYLKAVVLEGLRRHPAGHLLLPHRVTKEVEVEGYKIPEGATINFMVSEIGCDPKVWDDPMEFKPERFLMNGDTIFDITGSKGIKMMPFGAGRRMCPGYDLAMLHLEYFVANLILLFRWTATDGYEVDLSEKTEVTILMKNPLRTRIFPRA